MLRACGRSPLFPGEFAACLRRLVGRSARSASRVSNSLSLSSFIAHCGDVTMMGNIVGTRASANAIGGGGVLSSKFCTGRRRRSPQSAARSSYESEQIARAAEGGGGGLAPRGTDTLATAARIVMPPAGASDVGKTTLIRSMLHQFEEERSAASAEACLVGSHVYHLLRDVLRAMSAAGLEFSSPDLKRHASGLTKLNQFDTHAEQYATPRLRFDHPLFLPCADFIRRIACITCLRVPLSPRRVRHGPELSRILSDPAITALLEAGDVDGRGVGLSSSLSSSLRHSHVNLPRHTKWFLLESRERILSDGYLPLRNDLLRLRVRTTGLARHEMRKLNRSFEVYDLGGMRAERRKWVNVIGHADCALFVASVSEACIQGGASLCTMHLSQPSPFPPPLPHLLSRHSAPSGTVPSRRTPPQTAWPETRTYAHLPCRSWLH